MREFRDLTFVCIECGKTFTGKAHNTKRCPECRYERLKRKARNRYHEIKAGTYQPQAPGRPRKDKKKNVVKPMSICWGCANAVPGHKNGKLYGCSWSEDFKPVEGWDATKGRIGYMVIGCPKFIPDAEAMERAKPKPIPKPVLKKPEKEKYIPESVKYWLRLGM